MFYHRRTNIDFIWHGLDADGRRLRGNIKATDKKSVFSLLNQQQITPLKIQRHARRKKHHGPLTQQQLIYFSQQLAQLVLAGISISQSLLIIANGLRKHAPWILNLKNNIDQGMSLAISLTQYPQHFDAIYCAMVSSGEHTGKLGEMLVELVNYLEAIYFFKQKIRKALYYPAMVTTVALLITIGLMLFVIPQFQQLFASFDTQLPVLTRALIALSNFIHHQFLLLSTLIMTLFVGMRFLLKNNFHFRHLIQTGLLQIPWLGRIIITMMLTVWMKILYTTLTAGIPLIDALHMANQVVSNSRISHALTSLTSAVNRGESLYHAMQQCHLFSEANIQFVFVGETTGQLDLMLQKLAQNYQQQLDNLFDTLTKLLEPAIMLLLALFASLLLVAMYFPIFRMGSLL